MTIPVDGRALDGNAMAGRILDVLTADFTTASGRCVGCGTTVTLARARVYADAPGTVMRCPSCEHVLVRLVRSPDRAWLDLAGLAYLEVALGDDR